VRGRGRAALVASAALAAIAWYALRAPAVARVVLDCVPGHAHGFAIE
jgi:hypothetical protein